MKPAERTLYMVETTYLEEGLTVWDLVARVADALLPWARFYRAQLIVPQRDVTLTQRSGPLPEDLKARQALLHAVLDWIRTGSEDSSCFALRLFEHESDYQRPFFEFPDVPHDWSLFLTAGQWEAVRQALHDAGFPHDLFFEADQMRCVPWPGTRWRDRLLRRLGVQRCFTPREWRRRVTQ